MLSLTMAINFIIQPVDLPFQQFFFVIAPVESDGFGNRCFHECGVGIGILLIELSDCTDDGFLELVFPESGRFLAVLCAVVQAVDTAPHDAFLASDVPVDALVGAAALGAEFARVARLAAAASPALYGWGRSGSRLRLRRLLLRAC